MIAGRKFTTLIATAMAIPALADASGGNTGILRRLGAQFL
jgi:hypothetical protein